MKFGDDWTGVFLRGDDALPYGMMLEQLLQGLPENLPPEIHLHAMMLRGFADMLRDANEHTGSRETRQELRPFEECLKPRG